MKKTGSKKSKIEFDFDLAGLGDVSPEVETLVLENESDIDAILDKIEKEVVKFKSESLSFEENDLLYNSGISANDKKAWVYYQRTYRGIEMKGWEKYFIKGTQNELFDLVKAGSLYYSNGQYLPYSLFGWGNIYDREDQLNDDAEFIVSQFGQEIYNRHLEAVEKAKPQMLRIDDADELRRPIITAISTTAKTFKVAGLRAEWSEDVEKSEQIDKKGNRVKKDKRIDLSFSENNRYPLIEVFIKWLYVIEQKRYFDKSTPFAVSNYYIGGFPISGSDAELTAAEKAQIKQNAREDGERLFSIFLREALLQEDIERLNRAWNRKYNGWSDLQHSTIPIGLQTSATFLGKGFAIRPEKREGIAYMSAVGAGIIAYDVGVGKTITALLELASALQQGKCKRALLVVPNPTYKNWIREAFGGVDDETGEKYNGILSNTGIVLNEWYNLGSAVVKKLDKTNILTKEVQEKSITILTYEGFKNLGFSDAVASGFVSEFINIMEQNQIDPTLLSNNELEGLGKRSTRDDAKTNEQYLEIIGLGAKKNTVADVDVLGFDYIVIDEAHRCKNIFSGVKADERGVKNYLLSGSQSTTGIKAFFITNYIQRISAKGKGNVMLLTATPFTNSPLEVYSMMSLVAYDYLVDNGIYNINDFFSLFVSPTPEYVVKYDGSVVVKDTIKGYTNRLILQKLVFTKINYKSGDSLVPPLQRPVKVNLPRMYENINGKTFRLPPEKQVLTYLRMNDMQADNQLEIYDRLSRIKRENFTDLLRYLNASQDNAFSPYLYKLGDQQPAASYREFVENSPKIKYAVECIRTIQKHHLKTGTPMSGQIIYSDRGVAYFGLIKEYLIKELKFKNEVYFDGRRLSEVMIISGGDSGDGDKELIKEAFLAGIVKVIIGSSAIREGINLQTYGTTIFDLRPDWNPTDFRQLEGRIHRQKNKFGYVRIVMPLVENSMDVFMFQKLEEKTSRINDIFYREGSSNMLDLSTLDPSEIKYALISDIPALASMDFAIELAKAEKKISILADDVKELTSLESNIEELSREKANAIEYIRGTAIVRLANVIEQFKDKELTDEQKKVFERAKKLWQDLNAFLDNQSEEHLVGFKLRFENWNRLINFNYSYNLQPYRIDNFSSVYKDVRKAEKQILKPKGLTLSSNFSEISKTIRDEYEKEEFLFSLQFGIEDVNDKGNSYFRPLTLSERDKLTTLPNPPKRFKEFVEYINQKKKELAIEGRDIMQRVEEFASLNYLLDYSMNEIDPKNHTLPEPGSKIIQVSTCPPMDKEGNRRIDEPALRMLDECIANEPQTKELHSDKNGRYTNERLFLHEQIIAKFKDNKPCITTDQPIAILTGGAPGSGKSSFLKRFAPWISAGNMYHIDADEVRAMLPEYKGWNAASTHQETKDIVNVLLSEIGNPCNHDLIYDGTMNKAANYKPLINTLRKLGYRVFVIYIEVPKEVSIERAMGRYQRKGRYVPLSVIEEVYERGLDAFNEVINMADGYIKVNGMTSEIDKQGGMSLPEERNYKFDVDKSDTTIGPKGKVKPGKNLKLIKLKAKALKLKLKLI